MNLYMSDIVVNQTTFLHWIDSSPQPQVPCDVLTAKLWSCVVLTYDIGIFVRKQCYSHQDQRCRFSRNIAYIIPKIIYHYKQKHIHRIKVNERTDLILEKLTWPTRMSLHCASCPASCLNKKLKLHLFEYVAHIQIRISSQQIIISAAPKSILYGFTGLSPAVRGVSETVCCA